MIIGVSSALLLVIGMIVVTTIVTSMIPSAVVVLASSKVPSRATKVALAAWSASLASHGCTWESVEASIALRVAGVIAGP